VRTHRRARERESGHASEQAEVAFETILLRQARADEAGKFAAYIERYGLANACQLLVNSSEFLYLD